MIFLPFFSAYGYLKALLIRIIIMLQMNIATLYLFYAFSLLAYCKSDIELRSSLVAVPQIQDSYDVVH